MRISGWAAFIAALALAQAAEAQVLGPGPTVITTDNTGQVIPGVDFTIPGDGLTYRWDLWADSAHPGALISLGGPNDIFAVGQISKGDGTTDFDFALPDPIYMWDPTYAPGHTSILVQTQRSFDNCSSATPAGVLCAISYNVQGDTVQLGVDVQDAVTISFTSTPVPEPATWLLLLTGAAGLGAALRRRRSLRPAGSALV